MAILKPAELPLPKFAMGLRASPGSPLSSFNKRGSTDSPLSSPALPSPAVKGLSEFSTEKIPVIKTGQFAMSVRNARPPSASQGQD